MTNQSGATPDANGQRGRVGGTGKVGKLVKVYQQHKDDPHSGHHSVGPGSSPVKVKQASSFMHQNQWEACLAFPHTIESTYTSSHRNHYEVE